MTPKQQVEDSAWRRAVLEAEHEVFRRTAGHCNFGDRNNEFHSGGYKTVEEYALNKRTKAYTCIELLKAAIVEHDRVPFDPANGPVYCGGQNELEARRKIWKAEVENRERDLIGSIAGIDGGKHHKETVIQYAERSLKLQQDALAKLEFARKGLAKVTDEMLSKTTNKKADQDWSPCG